jgi:hypothetical protein
MARIRNCYALDDRRRGSFDPIDSLDCIHDTWAASDTQHVQPRLQEQGTYTTEHDDDIDRVEIFCGADCRPYQAQVQPEEQEQKVQKGGSSAQGGGGREIDVAEYDDNGDYGNSRTIARCEHDSSNHSYVIARRSCYHISRAIARCGDRQSDIVWWNRVEP